MGAGNSSGPTPGHCSVAFTSIWVSASMTSELTRKSRLLWPFANWPSSSVSMMSFIILPLILVYTRCGPKQFSRVAYEDFKRSRRCSHLNVPPGALEQERAQKTLSYAAEHYPG